MSISSSSCLGVKRPANAVGIPIKRKGFTFASLPKKTKSLKLFALPNPKPLPDKKAGAKFNAAKPKAALM